jgi:hypothetical protein
LSSILIKGKLIMNILFKIVAEIEEYYRKINQARNQLENR